MWKKSGRKYIRGLMLPGLLCLSSCVPVNYSGCPVYPVAGAKVAAELEQAGELPATWEWIGRIDKLRQELELCR